MKIRLYHYWRSSSSWRVRWALELKKVQYETASIDLLNNDSESPEHLRRNPMGFVPVVEVLELEDSLSGGSKPRKIEPPHSYLAESMAIIEWLEEVHPEPSLLPGDSLQRAKIRQMAESINAGIQPICNLNVIEYHSASPDERKKWSQHWIRRGLNAYQKGITNLAGKFSVGDQITLADLFLIPQIYNAIRNDIDPKEFPLLEKIYNTARATAACKKAAPEQFEPVGHKK